MIERDISDKVIGSKNDYPVLTLTGPRQAGKTTLLKALFPDKPYFNLESPDLAELARDDPKKFLAQCNDGAILDEIQNTPELLSYIQVIVDEADKEGMFILSGSQQLSLNQAITQSLAGRTALLDLLPLSIHELQKADFDLSLDEHLLFGGLPRIFNKSLQPTEAYRNYLKTYVERDVRELINIKDLSKFQKFIKLLAGRIGQVFNASNLSNEVGVSAPTIDNWLSILEASYIIVRLEPYYENFGKRVIKSPKIYFTEVGLVTYLLGIENLTQLERDPLYGQLVENLIVMELIKTRLNQGKDPNLYYYRDNSGNEIDVVYKNGNQLIPIEIKSAQTYTKSFFKNLKFFKKLVGERCPKSYLIYAGERAAEIDDIELVNFKNSGKILLWE